MEKDSELVSNGVFEFVDGPAFINKKTIKGQLLIGFFSDPQLLYSIGYKH